MQRCFQEESLVLKMKTSNYFHRMKPKCTCGSVLQELVRSRTSRLCITQNLATSGNSFSKCHHGQAYDRLVFHVPTKYFEAGLSCQSSGRRKILMRPSATTTFKFSADRERTLYKGLWKGKMQLWGTGRPNRPWRISRIVYAENYYAGTYTQQSNAARAYLI